MQDAVTDLDGGRVVGDDPGRELGLGGEEPRVDALAVLDGHGPHDGPHLDPGRRLEPQRDGNEVPHLRRHREPQLPVSMGPWAEGARSQEKSVAQI